MKSIVITERNRDGAKLWFEPTPDPSIYTIHTNKDYVLEYTSINYDIVDDKDEKWDFSFESDGKIMKGNIISYDPSGGPYMSIGSTIGNTNYILKRVYVINKQTYFEIE